MKPRKIMCGQYAYGRNSHNMIVFCVMFFKNFFFKKLTLEMTTATIYIFFTIVCKLLTETAYVKKMRTSGDIHF